MGAQRSQPTLQENGIGVVIVDTNPHHAKQARMDRAQGLPAQPPQRRKRTNTSTWPGSDACVALTPNDEVNMLSAMHYVDLFGRAEVYHLPLATERGTAMAPAHMRGRLAVRRGRDVRGACTARFGRGAQFKATPLTDQFDFAAWRAKYGEGALAARRRSTRRAR